MTQTEIDKSKTDNDISTANNGRTWFATKQIYGPLNTISVCVSGPTEDFAVSSLLEALEAIDFSKGLLSVEEAKS